MKYVVNENCIGCGMCEGTCPDVFHIEDGIAVAIDMEVPDSAALSATDAQAECPVGAIVEAE